MTIQKNHSPVLPNHPNNHQEVKEEEEEMPEEEEDEVEEAEVPALGRFKDPSYQGTLKMVTIQITNRPQMANCKDQSMDSHFAIIAGELATKGSIAQ